MNNTFQNCSMIPLSGCPTQFHEIEFKGWKGITFTCDDETLNEMIELADKTCFLFVDTYKNKYAFTEPMLSFSADGKNFSLKIGMMELELFHEIYGEKKNSSPQSHKD